MAFDSFEITKAYPIENFQCSKSFMFEIVVRMMLMKKYYMKWQWMAIVIIFIYILYSCPVQSQFGRLVGYIV